MTDLAPSLPALSALLQVILIDVALSGDNAIVIALAASGLPAHQRRKAIAIGIGAAIALRVVFAVSAVYLLDVPGLLLVGGLMLGWVCVKMWRELRAESKAEAQHVEHKAKTLRDAVLQITFADVSMSLDNVLAVVRGGARSRVRHGRGPHAGHCDDGVRRQCHRSAPAPLALAELRGTRADRVRVHQDGRRGFGRESRLASHAAAVTA